MRVSNVTLKSNGSIQLSHRARQRLHYRFKKIMAKHNIPIKKGTSNQTKALICLLNELIGNAPRHYRKWFEKRR